MSELKNKPRKPIFPYTPKSVPVLDKDGNVIDYEVPLVIPCTLQESDKIREKSHCAERGLSADPNNQTGFRATLDLINQNRNVSGTGVVRQSADDCQAMHTASKYVKSVKSNYKKSAK